MFGFSGSLNVNLGGLTSSVTNKVNAGVNLVNQVTSTPINANVSFEAKLKEQYESKFNNYEFKIKEYVSQINQYTVQIQTYETRIKESERKQANIKTEWNEKYEVLVKDKNYVTQERDSYAAQLEASRKENATLRFNISQLETSTSHLNERLRFLEGDFSLKAQRMQEMESKLINATNQINESLSTDVSQEEQLKQQREMIINLSTELERMKIEDAAEDIKFAEMEATINLKNDEIANLKKHIDELNEKVTLAESCSSVETTDVYLQLEGRYNDAVAERDQLSLQISIRSNQIRDLESRIQNLTGKITTITKSIEEYKISIEAAECREMDLKRSLAEYEMRINILIKDSSNKDNKIASYENVVKNKDTRIQQLTELVKGRDTKIQELESRNAEGNNAISELRQQLEKRLAEISEWKAEDQRDNAQIESLINSLQEQNATIQKWEEENARDDARIAELEQLINEKDNTIAKLKEVIFNLRDKFISVRNSTISLELHQAETVKERISSHHAEVVNSSQYVSLQTELQTKSDEVTRLQEEINRLRQDLEEAEATRSDMKKQIRALEDQVRAVNDEKTSLTMRISTFESNVSSFTEKLEVYTVSNRTAVDRVNQLKDSVNATTEEVEGLFKEIETILV
jgi:chromosome segregation ATPase